MWVLQGTSSKQIIAWLAAIHQALLTSGFEVTMQEGVYLARDSQNNNIVRSSGLQEKVNAITAFVVKPSEDLLKSKITLTFSEDEHQKFIGENYLLHSRLTVWLILI